MLAALSYRKGFNPSLSTEMVRQCKRHNMISQELGRLRKWGLSEPARSFSVTKMLSALVNMSNPTLDLSLQTDALMTSELIYKVRQSSLSPRSSIAQAWVEYCETQCGLRSMPLTTTGMRSPDVVDTCMRLALEMNQDEDLPDESPPPYSEPIREEAFDEVDVEVSLDLTGDTSRARVAELIKQLTSAVSVSWAGSLFQFILYNIF
jgi:hypothetical protein